MNEINYKSTDLGISQQDLDIVQHENNKNNRANNSLYLPARNIEKEEFNSQALIKLANTMHEIMHKKEGIGIAANQIGKNLQIFLIEVKSDENTRYKKENLEDISLQVFINPKINKVSNEKVSFWHGCLSAVGEKLGNVATYKWLEYQAQNIKGEMQTGRLDGLAAVIFQHELRHLLGGTYLDKAKTLLSVDEFTKKMKDGEVSNLEEETHNLPLLIDDYKIGETLENYYLRTSK